MPRDDAGEGDRSPLDQGRSWYGLGGAYQAFLKPLASIKLQKIYYCSHEKN